MSGKWLVHGEPIGARDIERIVGTQFTDLREFIKLCNSLAWAHEGSVAGSVPSFTERYEVPDGGIDGEWAVTAFESEKGTSSIVARGWNVFQHKQADILANGRNECFKSLKTKVSGSATNIHERTKKRPRGFVLFTNLDLSHDTQAVNKNGKKTQAWTKDLREAILKDYDAPDTVKVEIVGAAELAAMLNDLPHLRSAFFCRSDFITWDEAWREHSGGFLKGTVPLKGRDHDLRSLKWALENPVVRAIAVSGAKDIGKTRLILEATKDRSMDTVVARNPLPVTPGDLSSLLKEGPLTIVLIQDYEPRMSEEVIKYATTQENLKLIVEVHFPEDLVLPGFGQDERVLDFPLRAISSGDSFTLLRDAQAKFKSGVEAWVLDQANGNPGLLLRAAHQASELTTRPASFVQEIVRFMKKEIQRDLGADRLETLRFLSLFHPTPLHKNAAEAIRVIAQALGIPEARLRSIQDDVEIFRDRGVIRRGEKFAVVEPTLLANELASEIIERAARPLCAAFVELSSDVQLCILHRLRQLSGPAIDEFWDRLFGTEGHFAQVDFSESQLDLLLACAAQIPVTVADKILAELQSLDPDRRRKLVRYVRGELIWLLQRLLMRRETAAIALRCLELLVEVDETPENRRPNAAAEFREAFHPLHRRVAIPLQERVAILKNYSNRSSPYWLRFFALEAIRIALKHRIAYLVQRIPSPIPHSDVNIVDFREAFAYQDQVFEILLETAKSKENDLSRKAGRIVPSAIAEIAFAGRVQKALQKFNDAVELALQDPPVIPAAQLGGQLERFRDRFIDQTKKEDKNVDGNILQERINQLESMINRLDESGDFEIRLKRWAGPWTYADRETESEGTGEVELRCDRELSALAHEASRDPSLLTDDLMKWLSSKEAAKDRKFFWLLGMYDNQRKWLSVIEEEGKSENGVTAFSNYFGGLNQVDPALASERIDHINREKEVQPAARMFASMHLGPASIGTDRLKELVTEPEILALVRRDPILLAPWSDEMSSEDCLGLLKVIAGQDYHNSISALEYLSDWLNNKAHMEESLLDFAEKCLLAARPDYANDHICDLVAVKLARQDPERGFSLLAKLLEQAYEIHAWNPIDSDFQRRFWNELRSRQRKRAIELLLTATQHESALSWNVREILDQVRDEDTLASIAKESEKMAIIVCMCITAGRPGFWSIATQIVSLYPESDTIRTALSADWIFRRPMIAGPLSEYYNEQRIKAEQLLSDTSTPEKARPWLKKLIRDLQHRVKEYRRIEADWALQ